MSTTAKILETGKDFNVFDLPFKKFAPILKDSNGTEITCSTVDVYDPEDVNYTYHGASISGLGSSCSVYLNAYRENGRIEYSIEAYNGEDV